MTKIDIFSGFLGAGKTTLIKKLIKEAYTKEKVVLIENEFGEIGIDGGFLQDAGIEITEMNSGCICCSLVGDFTKALEKVLDEYHPDRIIIEPSGVGKLSDIIKAVKKIESADAVLNCFTTVADAGKCRMYMKNFGEFYNDQVSYASAIVLSHTDTASEKKVSEAVSLIREKNPDAVLITTPIDKLSGEEILLAMERRDTLADALAKLEEEAHEHHHHHHDHDEECECGCHGHHHHDHDEECECHGHHHDHDEECECHGHHHHDHDEECECHDHHHHDHGEDCNCGCHDHHHHHADEVFVSVGIETTNKYTKQQLQDILEQLDEEDSLGVVLRAKGIVECPCGKWLHFDYVPGEADVREGSASVIGRLCVIGSGLDKDKIKALFGV